MTLRYVNTFAALLLTSMVFGQFELGAYMEGGLTITNRIKDQSLPLLVSKDENFDDLNYFATDWEVSDSYGWGAFFQAELPNGLNIGERFGMNSTLIRYKGYNDYNQEFYEDIYGDFNSYNTAQGGNATQEGYAAYIDSKRPQHQNSFDILTRRKMTTLSLFVGKSFNTYKSWRPYILGSVGGSIDLGGAEVLRADLGETNVVTKPSFDYDFDGNMMNVLISATGGVEWRNWKLYGNITIPLKKERKQHDIDYGKATSFPYSYWARFNIGLATRFNGPTYKPPHDRFIQPQDEGELLGKPVLGWTSSTMQHRQSKFWEFGIGASLMPITFVGIDFDKGAAFLSMKTTQDTIIPSIIGADPIIRDRVKMEQAEFLFRPDAKGAYAFGIYNAFRFKKFRLQTDLFYRPLDIHFSSDERSQEFVEYSPGNFSPEADSWIQSGDRKLLLKYHELSIRSRLVWSIHINKQQKLFDVYIGYDLNFLKLRDQFYRDGNTNALDMYEDLHQILMGNETPENMADMYVNFDRDQIPFSLEETFNDPGVAFTPIAESEFIQQNTLLMGNGVAFGLGYTYRKFTANLGATMKLTSENRRLKGRTFLEDFGYLQLSMYLMLFGY
jgi:hypothetical protein